MGQLDQFRSEFVLQTVKDKMNEYCLTKNPFTDNLLRLERYSIENYIYDPINIFFSMKDFTVPQTFLDFSKNENLNKFQNKPMEDFFIQDENRNAKEIEDDLNRILQIVGDTLMDFISSEINKKDNELKKMFGKEYDKFVCALNSFKTRFGFKNDATFFETCKKKELRCSAELWHKTGKYNLNYNPFLLYMRGHCIENIFNKKLCFTMSVDCMRRNGFVYTKDLNELIQKLSSDDDRRCWNDEKK